MPLLKYRYQQQLTKTLCHLREQQGFSLFEVLIAALFFTVSLLGLLQYHQALLQGFSSLWQQRQAWSLLNQHIDSGGEQRPTDPSLSGEKSHWRYQQVMTKVDGECAEFYFTLTISPKRQAKLSRWFCSGEIKASD
ncbi:prepilin-type N-terminal cleavage/methylation domain-containing protein [Yersinia frederiksenii]|uniref:prepilin-type N-terminal cleavage/methylation domain-containing protein n=1 Tax=Yersinia frederiksenii TaxID=29484 RepID=UPI0036F31DA2